MNGILLTIIYVTIFIQIIVSIYGCIKIIQKKRFIKYENAIVSKQRYMKKHERKINIVFKSLFLIIMTITFILISLPGLKDIPNVLNKNYETVVGLSDTVTEPRRGASPSEVKVKSFSGKEVEVWFYPRSKIEKGDYLKVIYMPHLKIGTLLEHKRLKQ